MFFLKTIVLLGLSYSFVNAKIDIFKYKKLVKLAVSPDYPKDLIRFKGTFKDELSCTFYCAINNFTLFTLAMLENGKKECSFYNFLPEDDYIVQSDNTTMILHETTYLSKCPPDSPYEPLLRNSELPFSFRYLIQNITISWSNQYEIKCPNNKLIFVYSTLYGLQEKPWFASYPVTYPQVCYSRISYEIQKSICHGKYSCFIQANKNTFKNEPCFNNPTIFFSEYMCVGNKTFKSLNSCPIINKPPQELCPNRTDSMLNNQIWKNFEPAGANIQCPFGKKINISCVFLGFDTLNFKINSESITNLTAVYRHDRLYSIVKQLCEGTNTCTIPSSTASGISDYFFERKYSAEIPLQSIIFQVQWRC